MSFCKNTAQPFLTFQKKDSKTHTKQQQQEQEKHVTIYGL